MRLCEKYILWNINKLGGKLKRSVRRSFRLARIREIKETMILDIRTGHNVGDFRLDNQEVHDVMVFNKYTPEIKIRKLYFKYRR